MQLDDITIAVRPRSHREAMDLGMRLFQNYWRSIYRPWLFVVLPIFLLINLFLADHYFVAILLIWWMKPLYDRLMLHVYSHALFGQLPSRRETLKSLPALLKNGLWLQLTFLRLSPTRSFLLPVWQLENLKGDARRDRSRVLAARASGHAVWLSFAAFCLELLVFFTLYSLIFIVLPQNVDAEHLIPFLPDDPSPWATLLFTGLYQLSMLIIEPFYVAAGFMLYINRRTELEAWDIEISFRRLVQRLRALSSAAIIVVCLVIGMTSPEMVTASEAISNTTQPLASNLNEETAKQPLEADESKLVIEEVLEDEDFNTSKTITTRKLKDFDIDWGKLFDFEFDEDEEEEETDWSFLSPFINLFSAFANLFSGGFQIILVVLLIALIIYFIVTRKGWVKGLSRRRKVKQDDIPTTLFGMDIQPESLPEFISTAAARLWREGQHREALSLLYRGSLSRLVNRDSLVLHDAMTEADVLLQARNANLSRELVDYLSTLTLAWQTLAYGHRLPSEDRATDLFDRWPRFFDEIMRNEADPV